jgi:hypothetical protein
MLKEMTIRYKIVDGVVKLGGQSGDGNGTTETQDCCFGSLIPTAEMVLQATELILEGFTQALMQLDLLRR